MINANIGFQNFATAAGQESAHQERTGCPSDIHDTAMHSLINIIMLAESIDGKISSDQSQVSGMLDMIIHKPRTRSRKQGSRSGNCGTRRRVPRGAQGYP